jgi:hypothetical protein
VYAPPVYYAPPRVYYAPPIARFYYGGRYYHHGHGHGHRR